MKHFAIFLWMVIGFACVDLQQFEIDDDDFKADQDARKAASLDANQTITEDKAIGSKDDPASAQSSDETSNESEASENLSSTEKSMSVASEVKKSEQRAHLGKPVTDLRSILNHSHRNIAANQYLIWNNRSLPRTSAPHCPQRDTSLKSRVTFAWSYRTKIRGALAHRNVTNGTFEGFEDFDTSAVISLMVKGNVEAAAMIDTRLIQSYQEQYCDSAQLLLQDVASGYWNEVASLHDRHATHSQATAALREYWERKVKEFQTYRQSVDTSTIDMYMHVGFLRGDCDEGETIERVRTWFECPDELEMRFETMDAYGIVLLLLVVIVLCLIVGIFILFICTFGDLNRA